MENEKGKEQKKEKEQKMVGMTFRVPLMLKGILSHISVEKNLTIEKMMTSAVTMALKSELWISRADLEKSLAQIQAEAAAYTDVATTPDGTTTVDLKLDPALAKTGVTK